ncbi:MAG: DUF4258 domain-containing protein [Candidatus Gottesmanbacteria bacterium]|nr:DUF4258 domain-containing protein [Candidatus Gottesmanbacteria bacterium]
MIAFSDHALRKMQQRKLKKEWVLEALGEPDYSKPGHENRVIAFKKIEHLFLAVVYVKEDKNIVVITAHWEKGFKPIKEA